jgi:hypothetical protein
MINQCRFSKSVAFFQEDFMKKWNLVPYHNTNAPAIFVGVYRPEDVAAINNHKGFKVVCNTGKLRDIFLNINPKNVVVTATMGGCVDTSNDILKLKYKFKTCSFPIKDFSSFKPNPLGEKVYCYLGNESGKFVMGYEIAKQVQKRIPFEIIIGMQGNSMDFVKQNFYDKCFINLKPSVTGGLTSATELAYMGRYTISNSITPFCKKFNCVDDIIKIIYQESVKIGTIQPSVVGDFFTTGNEWKEVKFWL